MSFENQELGQYKKLTILGEGTYGKCYLVEHRTTGQLCVLKQIQIMGMTEAEIEEAVRQAQILQSLSHDFIIKFMGEFRSSDGYLNILMGYADGGDLSQKIKEMRLKKDMLFSQNQILQWFTQVCLAVQHVHERKIIHRDIKSQNIFLTRDGNVKLGDFGISRPLQRTLDKIKSVVGTPYYMSPEICDNKEYSLKTDIWSLGVLLLEMCLLKTPFDANSLPALALKISKGEYLPVPKSYSKQLKRLVADMMQVDPAKRPSIGEVLATPILRDKAKMMKYQVKDTELHISMLQLSMGSKKSSGASKGLFIDCNSDDYSCLEQSVSPKSQIGHGKHHDMPVKRDNLYSKPDKKKRGEQMRRKQFSEPNLTPKGHSKIQNQRKVMVKNNSQVAFEKKKSSNNPVCFKKKTKNNHDIAKGLEQIYQVKNDIYELQGQITHREKKINNFMEISELEPDEQNEQTNESPLETLQEMIRELTGQTDLSSLYDQCKAQGGRVPDGPAAGLLTLAMGLRGISV